jgi:hypothetical protein
MGLIVHRGKFQAAIFSPLAGQWPEVRAHLLYLLARHATGPSPVP